MCVVLMIYKTLTIYACIFILHILHHSALQKSRLKVSIITVSFLSNDIVNWNRSFILCYVLSTLQPYKKCTSSAFSIQLDLAIASYIISCNNKKLKKINKNEKCIIFLLYKLFTWKDYHLLFCLY